MQGEGPLDADPEGDLANGERLPKPAALTSDHDPLEDLDPLPPRFRHTYVHARRVAGAKQRDVFAQARLFNQIGLVHAISLPRGERVGRWPMIAPYPRNSRLGGLFGGPPFVRTAVGAHRLGF